MINRLFAFSVLCAIAAAQDTDSGPPKLKRGRPDGTRQTTGTSDAPTAATSGPSEPSDGPTLRRGAQPPAATESEDPFLDRAREAALSFNEGLPNFLCQELVTRYQSEARPVSWHAMDTLTMDLVYEDHKEDYRNIKIGGKSSNIEKLKASGAWSNGDFGQLQAGLFNPGAEADFRKGGSDRIEGKDALRYEFSVEQDRSSWDLTFDGKKITVGYKGTAWLERSTARVLRLEMQAVRIPTGYPINASEWSLDYAYSRINNQEYLLPARSEVLSCQRGSRFCSRNVIDFRNYRRFGGESSITFDPQ